ncbi:hypothetical protein IMZ48_01315 [Candidatus Bathyarchaeota archaeon]|nr:hypothetical protein [Candidatus Bathyarchaeota archaeon]
MKLIIILTLLATLETTTLETTTLETASPEAISGDLSTYRHSAAGDDSPFVMWSCCKVPGRTYPSGQTSDQRTRLENNNGVFTAKWAGGKGTCRGCRFQAGMLGCFCDVKWTGLVGFCNLFLVYVSSVVLCLVVLLLFLYPSSSLTVFMSLLLSKQ